MNISTSECSSGCESGWTTYLDQSLNSADQYPRGSYKNHWSTGSSVYEEEEEEDLSIVSDASSGPRHFHGEEHFYGESGNYSYPDLEQGKNSKQNKKVKEQRDAGKKQQDSFLDDTASSSVLSYYSKKNLAFPDNQASMEHETLQGFSETHYKGKSSLKKHFGFLKSSVSGKAASEKSVCREESGNKKCPVPAAAGAAAQKREKRCVRF